MLARLVSSLALLAVAACGGQSPLDTAGQAALPAESRATGPNGLEQRLTVVVDPDGFREPSFHTLLVKSTVTNTGTAPVRVAARICLFFDSDLETTAEADRFEPLVSCGAVQETRELAPGASVGPMVAHYRIRSGPGVYTVRVRHSLDPEFRAEASFRIP